MLCKGRGDGGEGEGWVVHGNEPSPPTLPPPPAFVKDSPSAALPGQGIFF